VLCVRGVRVGVVNEVRDDLRSSKEEKRRTKNFRFNQIGIGGLDKSF
jgi:hypothetical protein